MADEELEDFVFLLPGRDEGGAVAEEMRIGDGAKELDERIAGETIVELSVRVRRGGRRDTSSELPRLYSPE